jgi:HPt (histidine-containing phosphotransfer) domain-containing protein
VTPSPNTRDAIAGDLACPQAAASPASKVVDLDGLLARCMGNIDLAQRVLEKFQQRIPEDLAELEKALQLGDTELLARTAHRLRGCSATVSAEGLAQAAAGIEDASRSGREADMPACIERLRDECKKLVEMSSDLVAGG